MTQGTINSEDFAVLRNRGDGTFDPRVTSRVGNSALSVALGDLDGDGDVDAAVGNHLNSAGIESGSTVSVLLNLGAATFDPQVEYAVGNGPRSVALADLDRDGRVDIAAASSSAAVSVLRGLGGGEFAAPVLFGTAGADPWSLALGDIDGDGDPDLAVANRGEQNTGPGNVSVLFNQTVR